MNLVCFSNLNYSVILSGIASHGDQEREEADKVDIADISAELTSRLATWQVGITWSSSLLESPRYHQVERQDLGGLGEEQPEVITEVLY